MLSSTTSGYTKRAPPQQFPLLKPGGKVPAKKQAIESVDYYEESMQSKDRQIEELK
jgi:hypothetical protein